MNYQWTAWTATNLAKGVSPLKLVTTMVENSVPEAEAFTCVSTVLASPFFLDLSKLDQKLQKAYSILQILQRLKEQTPDYGIIKKIDPPTMDEFVKDYWTACYPVVIKGLTADWPARTKWSLEWIRHNFGDEMIEIQEGRDNDPEFELNSLSLKKKCTLGDFIQRIFDCESSNDFYMTANNHSLEHTRLGEMMNDIGTLPEYINGALTTGYWHLWMGPKGTRTPLHHDENALLHTQLAGRKKWYFIPPYELPNVYNTRGVFSEVDIFNIDYTKFPEMQSVKILEVVVEPGETMFLPVGWWHAVESLDRSISTSFINFNLPNNWIFKNPQDTR